jgi:hypothetical protein
LSPLRLAAAEAVVDERRGQVPILERRARDAGLDRIRRLRDLVPLLLPHTAYKSYPATFVTRKRWSIWRSHFADEADFNGCEFAGQASFLGVRYDGDAHFAGVTFSEQASFGGIAEAGDAVFGNVTFNETQFAGGAMFGRITVTGIAAFEKSRFLHAVAFEGAQLADVTRNNALVYPDGGFIRTWPPGRRLSPTSSGEWVELVRG